MIRRRLFRRDPHEAPAAALYHGVVTQARSPAFYRELGVPDSLDGRFDLLALHAFLVLHRLKREHADTATLAQSLIDTIFADMDRSLREMGAGDMGVGPRVKRMAQGFYGRLAAYEAALAAPSESAGAGGEDALEAALRRNLYGTVRPEPEHVRIMAEYVRRETAALAEQPTARLIAGEARFGAPPTAAGEPGIDSEKSEPIY